MKSKWGKVLLVVGICTAFLLMVVGVAFAVTQSGDGGCRNPGKERMESTGESRGRVKADLADSLSLKVEELDEKLEAGMALSEIAEEQGVPAEEVLDRIQGSIKEVKGEARGKVEDARGARDLLVDHYGEIKETVAEELGLSVEEMEEELTGGKTVKELAGERGVSVDRLVEAANSRVAEIVDRGVADGEISEEMAERIESRLAERILERIESGKGGLPGDRGHSGQYETGE